MKRIILLSLLSLCLSCTSIQINRQEAYRKNKEYIKQLYDVDIDNKNAGFYIKGSNFYFKTRHNGYIYEVKLDAKGNIISSRMY